MNLRMKIRMRSQQGFSLATVLVISMIVGLLMMGLFECIMPSIRGVMHTKKNTALRCAAESGLDYVVNRIAAGDQSCIPVAGSTKTISVPSNIVGSYGGIGVTTNCTIQNVSCPSTSYLYNSLLDTNNKASGVAANGWLVVTSTGSTGSSNHRLRAVMKPLYTVVTTSTPVTATVPVPVTVTSVEQVPFNWPNAGLALAGNFTGNGGITINSYNSKSDPNGNTNTHNGDMHANGNISQSAKSGTIDGDVTYTPSSTVDLGGTVTGNKTIGEYMQFPPPPSAPSGAKSLSPISGATTLTAGDYVITSDGPAISLSGTKALTITGPVRVWIKGKSPSVNLTGGGLVNNTMSPANFQLFYTPDNPSATEGQTNISIGGKSAFRGVVYAPNTNISLSGTSGFYGAIIAKDATLNGGGNGQDGAFHYDEALKGMTMFNWQNVVSKTTMQDQTTTTYVTTKNNAGGFQRSQCVSWEELD